MELDAIIQQVCPMVPSEQAASSSVVFAPEEAAESLVELLYLDLHRDPDHGWQDTPSVLWCGVGCVSCVCVSVCVCVCLCVCVCVCVSGEI